MKVRIGSVVNLLDTQIALVEAEEGIAIIPSFGMPVCRNREVVVSQLTNPVARFDFHLISNRGKELLNLPAATVTETALRFARCRGDTRTVSTFG